LFDVLVPPVVKATLPGLSVSPGLVVVVLESPTVFENAVDEVVLLKLDPIPPLLLFSAASPFRFEAPPNPILRLLSSEELLGDLNEFDVPENGDGFRVEPDDEKEDVGDRNDSLDCIAGEVGFDDDDLGLLSSEELLGDLNDFDVPENGDDFWVESDDEKEEDVGNRNDFSDFIAGEGGFDGDDDAEL